MKRTRQSTGLEADIANSTIVSHLSIQTHAVGRFRFSVVSPEALDASHYTLVNLAFDASASSHDMRRMMEQLVRGVVNSCLHLDNNGEVLLRVVTFGTFLNEVHGFKLLPQCNPADYRDAFRCIGMTALYDAALDGVQATAALGRYLRQRGCLANGVVVIVTDGLDNQSIYGTEQVRDALTIAVERDNLESIVSIFVGILDSDSPGHQEMSGSLRRLSDKMGFTHYVELDDWDAMGLARLIQFITDVCPERNQG
jgi:Mg-chelatase subunit ChlD